MNEIGRIIEGLEILKKYKQDATPYSSTNIRKVLELQESEFENIGEQDKKRLIELGWQNDNLTWRF